MAGEGVGLGRSCLLRNWVELGGGSKYRLFCLFCTSTYLDVFEMSYTSVQSIVFIYIYVYLYIFAFFGHGLNMIEPQARCW